MKSTIVTVGAVTYAIKLQKLLLRNGIRTQIIKVGSPEDNTGCTHGVEIKDENWLDAVFVMRENEISYKVYYG